MSGHRASFPAKARRAARQPAERNAPRPSRATRFFAPGRLQPRRAGPSDKTSRWAALLAAGRFTHHGTTRTDIK